jgi:hypothetical protein
MSDRTEHPERAQPTGEAEGSYEPPTVEDIETEMVDTSAAPGPEPPPPPI